MLSYGANTPERVSFPSGSASLTSIDAFSKDDVWAFGYYRGAYEDQEHLPLALHWDGREWSIVSAPSDDLTIRARSGAVARISKDDAWAAGPGLRILHWDGKAWSNVPVPHIGPSNTAGLYGVSAVSKDDVWAFGFYNDNPSPPVPVPVSTGAAPINTGAPTSTAAPTPRPWPWRSLLLHWDGRAWTEVHIPGFDPYSMDLSDLQAISKKEVWISGSLRGVEGQRPLILRWDGEKWIQLSPPDSGKPHDGSSQIEVASAGDVWAATYYFSQGSGPSQTFLSHWNGTAWTAISTPKVELWQSTLAISPQGVWLAGVSNQKALILRYTGSPCSGP
jgi:hypothetical protein